MARNVILYVVMDTPENYYATLGISFDADSDTIKRAYRQLARRYHPDMAGEAGAVQMKRINRAYAVLADPEQRQNYDLIMGGVVDLRNRGFARPRPRPQRPAEAEDSEFSGLNIFSTKGPLHAGPVIHNTHGIISALSSSQTVRCTLIAAGSLDGKGAIWQIIDGQATETIHFANDPALTIESLRALRFSAAGSLLAGWGRLGLHIWDAYHGTRLWSYALSERAVSAYYSLDVTLHITQNGQRYARMAAPHLPEDTQAPRSWGVRGTDVVSHDLNTPADKLFDLLTCTEQVMENRQFWAIRMRALAQDAKTLVTLSCAQVPQEKQQMALVRRWDLSTKGRTGKKNRPLVAASILVGRCEDCGPPYSVTPDAAMLAFVSMGNKIRLCDTASGSYSEVASGTMGGSSRLALSPDAQWLAVAREDSEVNEGVIDLWSVTSGQIIQKFYHPWQISALHFAGKQLVVALTDGTIQIWQ